MSFDIDELFSLLPAIYRIRDAKEGGQLRELLSVIAEQIAVLDEDISQLYDDQFIETCQEWVVPYIGDLIGVRGLRDSRIANFSQRAQVANTISYRRRKGTASMLRGLVKDVTGWDAHIVEYFGLLATAQYMNRLRPGNIPFADLRRWDLLDRLNKPFDGMAHNVDVRSIASARGRYNIPNIGIFLWRLRPFLIKDSQASKVSLTEPSSTSGNNFYYTFSPLGNNLQLFNRSSEPEGEAGLPVPINRIMLYEDVKMPGDKGPEYNGIYYGRDRSILIKVDGVVIPENDILACDLSDKLDSSGKVVDWQHVPAPAGKKLVDPVLGRIAFSSDQAPNDVKVNLCYGFSAEMGGGDYDRISSFDKNLEEELEREGRKIISVPRDFGTLKEALSALGTHNGIIELAGNGIHKWDEDIAITLSSGQRIEIRAENGSRPVMLLSADMKIDGPGQMVILNGLLISGGGLDLNNSLKSLKISHCTLVPGRILSLEGLPKMPWAQSLLIRDQGAGTVSKIDVEIDHSIMGPIIAPAEVATLDIEDSIIDSPARDRSVRRIPALVSGDLTNFALSSSTPIMIASIDDRAALISLGRKPHDLDEARRLLELAIRSADKSPGFVNARVIRAKNRLAILSGVSGQVTVLPAQIFDSGVLKEDPTAYELGLASRPGNEPALNVYAQVGGRLPSSLTLRSASPSLNVASDHGKQFKAVLTGLPAGQPSALDKVADSLQAAIQASADAPALQKAVVALLGNHLVVLPGAVGASIAFGPSDETTVVDLALTERPVIAASSDGQSPGPEMIIKRSTVLGSVHVKQLKIADEVIFADPIVVDELQYGCVRLSYVPDGSSVPRCFECLPRRSGTKAARLDFTSTRYGDPGYCQLGLLCDPDIKQGDGQAEMGAFHDLYQPQREANLRGRLNEYLRFGLEAGIFYGT